MIHASFDFLGKSNRCAGVRELLGRLVLKVLEENEVSMGEMDLLDHQGCLATLEFRYTFNKHL